MKLEEENAVRWSDLSETTQISRHMLRLELEAQIRHPELPGVYGQLETLLEWTREDLARIDRADRLAGSNFSADRPAA